MDSRFTLQDITIPVAEGVAITIGKLETEVKDYSIIEGLKVSHAMPGILAELKDVIISGIVDVKHAVDALQANEEACQCELSEDDEIEITLDMVAALNNGKFRTANGEYTVSFKSHAELIDEGLKGQLVDVTV